MDLNNTLLNVAIKDIDQLSPTEFTLARKAAFGGSDTGVLVGVNPYQTLEELLAQNPDNGYYQWQKRRGSNSRGLLSAN